MDAYPEVPLVAYEDIRTEIQTGDLLLCSGSSAMSRLIQEATDSVWSHVGFLLRSDMIGRIFVLESVESVGVVPATISHYLRDYQCSGKGYPGKVYLARDPRFAGVTEGKLIHFSQTAVDLFRRIYDKPELAKIAWRLMCKKVGRPVPPRTKNDAYICSEYVEECYCSVGLTMETQGDGFIAPHHFAQPPVQVLWELALAT